MSTPFTRRLLAPFAIVTIVMSLIGPMVTLAAPPPDDPLSDGTPCPEGMTWNDETQECVPPPDIPSVPINQQPDCPDGQVPNGNGGCVPDQQLPECPEGQVLDEQGACETVPDLPPPPCPTGQVYDEAGNCVPDQQPPECAPGFVLDEDWACVPDPNWQPPECPAGEVYDQDVPGCVPDPDDVPDTPECGEGEVYDQDLPGCVPAEQDQPVASGNRVNLTYHRCIDLGTSAVTLDLLFDTCERIEGVGFEGIFGVRVDIAETNSEGRIAFDDLPMGEWTIEPIDHDTDGTIQILGGCNIHIGMEHQNRARFEQLEGIFGEFDRPSGITYDCHWVDLVLRDALELTKYACPAGTDPDASLDELRDTCVPMAGTQFWLSDKGGSTSRTTDANGVASWSGLGHSGFSWYLQEDVPADYGQPTVWCGPSAGGAWTRQELRYAQVTITFPDHGGYGIECAWFNMLAADQGVFIHTLKFICPYGTPRDLDEGEWRTACEPGAGVEFTADFDGTVMTRTTGSDGTIEWGQMPIGPWTMSESIPGPSPAPYDEPIVFCGFVNPPAGSTVGTALFLRTSTNMAVSGTYTDDHRGLYLSCTWINIRNYPEPPDAPDSGSVPSGATLALGSTPPAHERTIS